MNYQKIWNKTLNKEEEVKHSFSIGEWYLNFNLIVWGIISAFLILVQGIGLVIFPVAFLYYKFYLKIANAYAFTNKRILVHTGWLSTKLTSIDYSKITDIHIREPFLDRIITKTGDIIINTAGSDATEVVLRHIESPYQLKKILDELRD